MKKWGIELYQLVSRAQLSSINLCHKLISINMSRIELYQSVSPIELYQLVSRQCTASANFIYASNEANNEKHKEVWEYQNKTL